VYLAALGPQGLKETANLCLQKAHYLADELCKIPGVSLKFKKPFFKEFTLQITKDVPALLEKLLTAGYHGGLALGRWYPPLGNCVTIAVTEKRTRAELDAFVTAFKAAV
jgi:glycine dehydrogenase subunit 1